MLNTSLQIEHWY